ncbi:MAG TPA: hypothetical protein DEA55_09890 [Rhodospirillaceae bacterium]|nr:hypothetical protein [Rhodospirillaceae bacterium]
MFNTQASRISLADNGQIMWQPDSSNPLPGTALAVVKKGEGILSPDVSLLESVPVQDQDRDALVVALREWLTAHIAKVLEPLVALGKAEEIPEGPVRDIAAQIHAAMGIIHRENIEALIAKLDHDGRAALRARRVRLGPILVFIPDLNKPAAVRLKALLWNLWQGQDLSANVPPDGVVSLKMEGKTYDPAFCRVIGYPVYGPRAIRIDMLDRVINCVYDNAKEGKFQARHEMAEWLGSSLPDLYAILEAMGHKKIFDPAEQPQPEAPEPAAEKTEDKTEEAPPAPKAKPELATFRLKKGKAFETRKPSDNKKKERDSRPDKKTDKKRRPDNKEKKKRDEPRVISVDAPVNPADSPFAILEQLRKKSGGQ